MPYQKRRPLNFGVLQERIDPTQILDLFGVHHWRERSGAHRGPCPIHRSANVHSRSFRVSNHLWYAGCCRKGGNAVQLYALLTAKDILTAAYELCDRFGIDPPYISE